MASETRLGRLRYVASHYRDLQGLILVPFGLMQIVAALQNGGRLWMAAGDMTWRMVWVGAAVIAAFGAKSYYERTVGRVWPALNAGGSYRRLAIAVGIALLLGYLIAPWFDSLVQPPISTSALVIAGLALIPYVASRRHYRAHYLYLALLYGVIALLPLTAVVTSARLVRDPVLFGVLYGVPWLIAGLGDHLFLMRSLKPIPHEEVDGSV